MPREEVQDKVAELMAAIGNQAAAEDMRAVAQQQL